MSQATWDTVFFQKKTGLSPSLVQVSAVFSFFIIKLHSPTTLIFHQFRQIPFRSPLLRKSIFLYFPLVNKMFQFTKLFLTDL